MQKKWWHNLVGYQVYPKSFQDSNQDGIGDIPGIIRRLDYLAELGINLLWVCPVYRSPMMDHGYDISDYTQVDPMFGTNRDLEELIRKAKERGITVIMDLVINHTSSEHPWFLEACRDPEGKYGQYYIIHKGKEGQPPNNWRSLFGGSAWEPIGESGYFYLHLFTKGQPDLNWDNEALRRELYQMINGWLEMGIGGFRIDAIAHIKKDLSGGNVPADGPDGLGNGMRFFRNMEGIEAYLQELKENTFQRYDCFTLAEVDDIPDSRLDAYIGEDGYYCTVFDFCHCHHNLRDGEWEGRGEEMLLDIRNRIFARQKAMNQRGFFCNYQENHDMTRIPDRFLKKEEQNFYSMSMLPVLYFYLAGIPMVYQGQEIGMTGFDRKSMEEYADPATFGIYRDYLMQGMTEEAALHKINASIREHSRTPMQWSSEKYAGFSQSEPWFACNPDYPSCNVERQQADENSLLSFFKKVIALRRDTDYQETWIYGGFTALEEDSAQLWSFERSLAGQRLQVFVNLTGREALTKSEVHGTVLLDNYGELAEANGRLALKAWQAVVLKAGEQQE